MNNGSEEMISCPKCKNTGDIILIADTLCWCPCGYHWILAEKNAEAPKIMAAFTCNNGHNVIIRLTTGKYNGEVKK